MQFQSSIDVYQFLKMGSYHTAISNAQADFLLRRVQGLIYRDLPSDHCDAGPRFVADRSSENEHGYALLDRLWSQIIETDLEGLARHYRSGADPHVTTVLKLGSGYALDWHNHLAAGCTATVLIYLFDDGDVGTGGDLVLGHLGADLRTPAETARFKIAHGDVVLIGDASHPLLMHKADRWEGSGSRYIISYAFNAKDW